MKSKLGKKHLDYLVLLIAAILSIVISLVYSANKQIVSISVISLAVFYFFWGIIHHKHEGSLHTEVVLEYLFYSIMGALLVVGLI